MSQRVQDKLALFHESDQSVNRGLPGSAYTCSDFYREEQEKIFSRHWAFVGFAHDIPSPGDVQPITLAGKPLLLVRGANQQIQVFHNVCRHRNLKLVDEKQHCHKMITCPYHRWSYDLNGELRLAPYFGGQKGSLPEDFDLKKNSLLKVDTEVWHDWIFVNWNGNAGPFESHIQPLQDQLGDADVADFLPVTSIDLGSVNCNWKLLMENFIEPYHVQFVHKTTTSQPLEDHYVVMDSHCLGSAIDLDDTDLDGKPVDKLAVSSRYLTLFPNFVLGSYYPDQIGVHLNQAVDAEHTIQKRVIYLHRDTKWNEEVAEGLQNLWRSVHLEDHGMCERLQQGRHSVVAEQGGVLSPHWESSVRRFQELVAGAMTR